MIAFFATSAIDLADQPVQQGLDQRHQQDEEVDRQRRRTVEHGRHAGGDHEEVEAYERQHHVEARRHAPAAEQVRQHADRRLALDHDEADAAERVRADTRAHPAGLDAGVLLADAVRQRAQQREVRRQQDLELGAGPGRLAVVDLGLRRELVARDTDRRVRVERDRRHERRHVVVMQVHTH
jgi:hypothetical protein